jgi:hypothetical protein
MSLRRIRVIVALSLSPLFLAGCVQSPSEDEVLLDKESVEIGTSCESVRNLVSVWEKSDSLIRLSRGLVQRSSMSTLDMALNQLIKLSEQADGRLNGFDFQDLEGEYRNKEGDISAADLAFYSHRALLIVQDANAKEEYSPSAVPTAELSDARDICRNFQNGIDLDDLLNETE